MGRYEFFRYEFLANDEIQLRLYKTVEANAEKWFVQAYHYNICDKLGNEMGRCRLRAGHNEKTYYGGNIGYEVYEAYRGHHYAAKACLLLFELARKLKMDYVIITCTPDNIASRKTCEYVECQFVDTVELPKDNDMRVSAGKTEVCIYRIGLN